jgi:DNA-damage-inducible protein J
MNEYYEMKAHPEKYKRYSSFRSAMKDVLEDKDA